MGTKRSNGPGFSSLYRIVRAFLHDFYSESKKGTIKHWKGLLLFLSFVFLCIIALSVVAYKVSEQPFFCGVCHNMKGYVDSWKASSHRNVGCIECHYKPGFKNHIIGKWKDGQVSLVYFVTGKVITKPHAEIDDASCLNSGCHKKSDLKEDIVFKNVVFNHLKHLDQTKRNTQLRCTTCHSQIVQGTHMTVTEVNCFICHFYKTNKQKSYVTGCTSCHFEAKGDIKKGNYLFNHKKYIKRGIACETCHTNVVSGNGHLPENVCFQCHNKRHILDAKYTPDTLHKNHVTDHKVECFLCHSPIKHKISGLAHATKGDQQCAQCHTNEVHLSELLMFTGKGARFVKDMPSGKASFNMDCSVCHVAKQNGEARRKTCKTCHGTLAENMLSQWEKTVKGRTASLTQEVKELQNKDLSPTQRKELTGILANNDYLARGKYVHNILYTLKVLDENRGIINELKGSATTSKHMSLQPTCTDTCHGDINEKKVAFGTINFPHEVHADGEESCLKCHGPYNNHGTTLLKGCSECHHGKGAGKVGCKDCHKAETAMLQTKGSLHVSLSCVKCHRAVPEGKKGISLVLNECVKCHEKGYREEAQRWMEKQQSLTKDLAVVKTGLEQGIGAIEKKTGKESVPLRKRFDEISEDVNMLLTGRYAHNPAYGDAILVRTQARIEALKKMMKQIREGKIIRLSK